MSAEGKKKDKGFIALLVLIIVCACLMIAAVTTLGIGMSGGMGGDQTGQQGEPGEPGSKWSTGEGAPADGSGVVGDLYLDRTTGDVYEKTESGWELALCIKGADGQSVVPHIGPNGHWYYGDTDTGVGAVDLDALKVEIKEDGYWYIGDEKTDYKAMAEITIDSEGYWCVNGKRVGNYKAYGSTWLTGEGQPKVEQGENGDLYLDTDSFDIYRKENNAWVSKGNIRGQVGPEGPQGNTGADGSVWYTGTGEGTTGAPADAKEGDYYLNTDSGDVYCKTASGWDLKGNIKGKTGAAGTDGSVWYTGKGADTTEAPADAKDGDYYLNTESGDVYRKGTSGWESQGNIKGADGSQGKPGADGKTWYNGEGDPDSVLSAEVKGKLQEGDFYFDTKSDKVYKYSGSVWDEIADLTPNHGSVWYAGEEEPTAENPKDAVDGDFYFCKSNNTIYKYNSSTEGKWDVVVDLTPNHGSVWFTGTGAPTAEKTAGAANGDYYLDTATCDVYKFENDAWSEKPIANIKGEAGIDAVTPHIGENGNWFIGGQDTGVSATGPAGSNGKTPSIGENGHWYIDGVDTGEVAVGSNGADGKTPFINDEGYWQIGDYVSNVRAAGADGKDGTYWHADDGIPTTDSETENEDKRYVDAADGDFYMNTATGDIYRLNGTEWVLITSVRFQLTGNEWTINGKGTGLYVTQWYNGEGEPRIPGYKGDYYLDTKNGKIYINVSEKVDSEGKGYDWEELLTIRGSKWFSGEGEPDTQKFGQTLVNDDMYLNTLDGQVYRYDAAAEAWVKIDGLVIQGKQGTRGQRMFAGSVSPAEFFKDYNEEDLLVGDLYFETSAGFLYTYTGNPDEPWQLLNKDDPLAGTKWLSGDKDPDEYVEGDPLYKALHTALEGDVYFNTAENTLWQVQGGHWIKLGTLAAARGTKMFYGGLDPYATTATDKEAFAALTADAIVGDMYLQTFYSFSGLKGFKLYAKIGERPVDGKAESIWELVLDMTSVADKNDYTIPNKDALRAFRDSVNGGNDYFHDPEHPELPGTRTTVTLTGVVTIPEGEDFGMIGESEDTPFSGIFDGGTEGLYIEGVNGPLFGYLKGATITNLEIHANLDELTLATFALDGKTSLLTGTYGIAKSADKDTTIENVKLVLENGDGKVTIKWDESGNVSVEVKGKSPAATYARARATSNADDYALVIRGQKLLLGDADFTFEHVRFEDNSGQNSYIDVTEAKSLTLIDCYADVNPVEACVRNDDGSSDENGNLLAGSDRSGYAAFIVSRPSSNDRTNALTLTVKDSKILSAQSKSDNDAAMPGRRHPDHESMAILINTKLAKAEITGNVFGTSEIPYTLSAVRLTSMAENATVTFDGNIVYGVNQYTGSDDVQYSTDFAALALADKDGSGVYTVTLSGNQVNVNKVAKTDAKYLSITGTGHAQVYFVGPSNQFNGSYAAADMLRSVNAEEESFDFVAFYASLEETKLTEARVYLGSNFGKDHQFKPENLAGKVATGHDHDVWIIDLAFADPLGFTQHVADYTTTYYVNNKFGLESFRDMVNGTYKEGVAANNFYDKTIVTTTDIDLDEMNWTPIGTDSKPFSGTFTTKYLDTQYAIKNLNIDSSAEDYTYPQPDKTRLGLFGYTTSATLTYIKISGVTIVAKNGHSPDDSVGALVGLAYSGNTLNNITVDGLISITGDFSRTGGVIGQTYGNFSDITVNADAGSVVSMTGGTDADYVGGILGHAGDNGEYKNLTVNNLKVIGGRNVGGVSGLIAKGSTVDNATLTGVHLLSLGSAGMNQSGPAQYIGAVGGSVTDGAQIIIKNVNFTGIMERAGHKYGYYCSNAVVNGGYVGPVHNSYNYQLGSVNYSENNNIYALIATDLYYRNGDYEIMSAHGLQRFADLVTKNTGNLRDSVEGHKATLMADIDLSVLKENGEWLKQSAPEGWTGSWTGYSYELTSIGNATNTFKGTFDGGIYDAEGKLTGSHTITGLTGSLFDTTNGATIKNLTLNDVNINIKGTTGDESIGALINVANETLIENVSVSGSVIGENCMAVGGIVGLTTTLTNPHALLKNVSFEGNVHGKGKMSMVGGIAGVTTVSIEKATVNATIVGTGAYSAGGIFGAAMEIRSGTTTVDETVHIKSVTVEGSVTGARWVGGVVGGVHTADFYDVMVKADLTKTHTDGDDVKSARGIGVVTGHTESQVKLGAVYFSGTIDNQYAADNLNYLVYNYGLVGDGSWRNTATDEWANGKGVSAPATVNVEYAEATGENATHGGKGEKGFTASVNAHIAATDLDLTVGFKIGTVAHDNTNGVLVTVKTALGLANIAELVNHGISFEGEVVMLGDDINMYSYQRNWKGIGTEEHPFEGTFTGNVAEPEFTNKVITFPYGSLFGYTNGATIQDLTLGDLVFQSKAALVENPTNTTITGVTIEGWVQAVGDNAILKASDVAAAPFGIVGAMTGTTSITNTEITIAFGNIIFHAKVDKDSNSTVSFTGDTLGADETASTHEYKAVITDEIFRLGGFNKNVNDNAPTAEFTFNGIKFTGNSYIDLSAGAERVAPVVDGLTVTNCYADIVPARYNGMYATFILGHSSNNGEVTTKLVFKNNVVLSNVSATEDTYQDVATAIFAYATIKDGSEISGNTFGSTEKPYHEAVVKFFRIVKGAKITVENNTVYTDAARVISGVSGGNRSAFIDLATTEATDEYEVWMKGNTVNVVCDTASAEKAKGYTLVSAESNTGSGPRKARIFITGDNHVNVNGEAVKLNFDNVIATSTWNCFDFIGYNVVLNGDGKITSGDFIFGHDSRFNSTEDEAMATALKSYVADGSEANIHIVVGEQFGRRLSDLLDGNYNTYYTFALEGVRTFVSLVNAETNNWDSTGKTVKLADELSAEIAAADGDAYTLDLSKVMEVWTPIGTDETHAFKGTFDGGYADAEGKPVHWKIKGLNYKGDMTAIGLFGYTDGATLRNVDLDSFTLEGTTNVDTRYTGMLVAHATGTDISNINISASTLTNYIGTAGALAGYLEGGSVSGITVNNTTLTASYTPNVGAVVGVAKNVTVDNVLVGGSIDKGAFVADPTAKVTVTASSKVGGVIGVAEYGVTLGNTAPVYSAAELLASAVTEETNFQIGGIIGALTVSGSDATFNVTNAHFSGSLNRNAWQSASSTKYENYGLVGGYTTKVTGTVTITSSTLDVVHFVDEKNAKDKFAQDTDWAENGGVTSEYQITGIEGFKFFRDQVNGGNTYAEYEEKAKSIKRETIHLMANIDLKGEEWKPIGYDEEAWANGTPKAQFMGVFTGYKATPDAEKDIIVNDVDSGYNFNPNAYTISNLVINGHNAHNDAEADVGGSNMGLFGRTQLAIIEYLNIDTAKVTGNLSVGVVVGTGDDTSFNNVTVANAVIKGHSWVGGLVGHNEGGDGNWTIDTDGYRNNLVVGLEGQAFPNKKIEGESPKFDYGAKLGGLAGYSKEEQFVNNTVAYANLTAYKDLGGLAGIDNGSAKDATGNTVKNVNLTIQRSGYTAEDPDGLAGYARDYDHVDAAKGQNVEWMVGRMNYDAAAAAAHGVNVEGGDFNNHKVDVSITLGDTENAHGLVYDNNAWHIVSREGLETFKQVNDASTGGTTWNGTGVNKGFGGTTVYLDCNIDLSEPVEPASYRARAARSAETPNWKPIGKGDDYFRGTFDGQGHSIKNMYIAEPNFEGNAHVGFFGNLAAGATVKDLVFEDPTVKIEATHKCYVGVLAGRINDSDQITVSDITIKGTVIVEATGSEVAVGGLAGVIGIATVSDITIEGDADSYVKSNMDVGGLAGVVNNGAVSLDKVDVKINVETTDAEGTYGVGGLVGTNGASSVLTVTNSNYEGEIKAPESAAIDKAEHAFVGKNLATVNPSIKDSTAQVVNGEGSDIETESFFYGAYADKDGKVAYGYIIKDVNGLAQFRDKVNSGELKTEGKTFALVADMDLSKLEGNWTPIGTESNRFFGTFDGNGHTVKNINMTGTKYLGFFGVVGNLDVNAEPVIKNLKLGGNNLIEINGVGNGYRNDTGILVGYAAKTAFENITYENGSTNKVMTPLTPSEVAFGSVVGGLVGAAQTCSFNHIELNGKVSVPCDMGDMVGGLIGLSLNSTLTDVTIKDLYAEGSIELGGVIGRVWNGATLNNVKVEKAQLYQMHTASYNNGKYPEDGLLVGGLIGAVSNGTVLVEDCSFTGQIERNWWSYDLPDYPNYGLVGKVESAGNVTIRSTDINLTARSYVQGQYWAEGVEDYTIELTVDGTVTAKSMAIKTAAGLYYFANLVNSGIDFAGATATLVNDIDLNNANWTPIGKGATSTSEAPAASFKGIFDGNSKTISKLTINAEADDQYKTYYYGFFASLDGATVRNLLFDNVTVNAPQAVGVGALAAYANNATIDDVQIANLTVEGLQYVGGIVGHANNVTVSNSGIYNGTAGNNAGIYLYSDKSGGIAGYLSGDSNISNNTLHYVKLGMKGENAWGSIGGIVGCFASTSGSVTGNYLVNVKIDATGAKDNSSPTDNPIAWRGRSGALAGNAGSETTGPSFTGNSGNLTVTTGGVLPYVISENNYGLVASGMNFTCSDNIININYDGLMMKNGTKDGKDGWHIEKLSDLQAFARFVSEGKAPYTPEEAKTDARFHEGYTFAGQNVYLDNPITLEGNWSPIGSVEHPFSGTFDGQGNSISGLKIEAADAAEYKYGFFSKLNGATVKNVTFASPNLNASKALGVGVVAADADQSVIENVTVTGATVSGAKYVGGIVGHAWAARLMNNTVSGTFEVTFQKLGAIAGHVYGGNVGTEGSAVTDNTVENVTLIACADSYGTVGGLIGGGSDKEVNVSGNTFGENVQIVINEGVKAGWAKYTGAIAGNPGKFNISGNKGTVTITIDNTIPAIEKGIVGDSTAKAYILGDNSDLTVLWNDIEITSEAYILKTKEDLVWFRNQVNGGNSFEGETVRLDAASGSIDLTNGGGQLIGLLSELTKLMPSRAPSTAMVTRSVG